MTKILYTSIGLCLCCIAAFGQYKIEGRIYDAETKEPAVGATVQLANNLSVGTTTNAQGFFQLNCSEQYPELNVSMIGYENQQVKTCDGPLSISMASRAEEMQTVVVTANREASLRTETPIAISKLSTKLIDETKPTQLVEALNKVPGVLMVNLNNEQHSMAIRQPMTTNAYFLYLEDGVPIRPLGVFNHNALLEISQFAISSVEVVKGPVSSIYGAEAIGGAVNFIMQRPTLVPTAKVGVQFDNFGFRRVQFGGGARTDETAIERKAQRLLDRHHGVG